MTDTRTCRLYQISGDLAEEGWYLSSNSVRKVTEERDAMLAALKALMASGWLSIDHDHNRTKEACDLRRQACAAIDSAR